MKTLCFSDIHHRVNWVEKFIKEVNPDEVVFHGDYFDEFGDTPDVSIHTAEWLRNSLTQENRVHILGNHDMGYMFPHNGEATNCSGCTVEKSKAINSVLKWSDWSRLFLCHFTQGFLLSHAGCNPKIFTHPVLGISIDIIKQRCDKALFNARENIYDEVIGCGAARMGRHRVGGVTWQDWNDEFDPIEGIKQIVGHTVSRNNPVRRYKDLHGKPLGENYCFDGFSTYCMLIENGSVKALRTGLRMPPPRRLW